MQPVGTPFQPSEVISDSSPSKPINFLFNISSFKSFVPSIIPDLDETTKKIGKVALPLIAAIACFAAIPLTGGTKWTLGLIFAGTIFAWLGAGNIDNEAFKYFKTVRQTEKV